MVSKNVLKIYENVCPHLQKQYTNVYTIVVIAITGDPIYSKVS